MRARKYLLIYMLALSALGVGCRAAPFADTVTTAGAAARRGMVVSAHRLASEVGVDVLRRGGNAVDAAVATGFALAVVFPEAGNLGGGGFMVVRTADGAATTFDYRERAPGAAHRDMYLDAAGNFLPHKSRLGHLAAGVPGSPAGLLRAHERFGRLPLREVMAPAVRLARDGYRLSGEQAGLLNYFRDQLAAFPASKRYFTRAAPFAEGDLFVQQDLARTLERIARSGHAGFYAGETADLIVAEMQRGGGLITHADLAAYRAVERTPVVGRYRGHRILSMGPPSSGGVALVQLLNALEPHPVAEMGWGSSRLAHLMGEAMRRVYADRAAHLGDPDVQQIPAEPLTRPGYMRARMQSFDPERVTPSAAVAAGDPWAAEPTETTHYSVVDAEGNAVSATTTINGLYGAFAAVEGAGFLLNNEMDDFSAKPGAPNLYGLLGSEANRIAPGKRMLSSMTPTIVEDPEGRLFMVIGSPGGSRIITIVLGVVVNVIDLGMDMPQAVAAPRLHHQWQPDVLEYERRALSEDAVHNLERRGWRMALHEGSWGRADGILVTYPEGGGRLLHGGADPRGEDAAVGY